jgi:hypothetical protein
MQPSVSATNDPYCGRSLHRFAALCLLVQTLNYRQPMVELSENSSFPYRPRLEACATRRGRSALMVSGAAVTSVNASARRHGFRV